jgi:hypothetical protein
MMYFSPTSNVKAHEVISEYMTTVSFTSPVHTRETLTRW